MKYLLDVISPGHHFASKLLGLFTKLGRAGEAEEGGVVFLGGESVGCPAE